MQLTKSRQPEVLVMDIAMPLLNGVGATQQFLETLLSTKMIVLAAHKVKAAYDAVLETGDPATRARDIGGKATTEQFTEAVLRHL